MYFHVWIIGLARIINLQKNEASGQGEPALSGQGEP